MPRKNRKVTISWEHCKIKLRPTIMWHRITFFWIEKHTHKWECHHHTEKLSSHFASQKLVVLSAHWVVEYHFLISSNYNTIWYHSSEIPKMFMKWTKIYKQYQNFWNTIFNITLYLLTCAQSGKKSEQLYSTTYHTTFNAIEILGI